MTASERVKLITQIAYELNKLGNRSIIDLTLNEFGITTFENFNGNNFDYILNQIQLAENINLEDLSAHLENNIVTPEISTFKIWKEGNFRLFISNLPSSENVAKELKINLENFCISSYIGHSDIKPTRAMEDEIEYGLNTCHALVALMTPGFHESDWTDQEIGLIVGRNKLIVPISMGQEPYGFIGKFQALKVSSNDNLALSIFEFLSTNLKTRKRMSESILFKFENSRSWNSAKKNMDLVEKIIYWDSHLINRLEGALKEYYIESAFDVKTRIKNVIYKYKNS
ncbi:MAG: toll/interleukin-1 receptor domain-containing protein [Bacteroidetes bacterium]|nr:toll/interleukin-1 receptor domain-containing protein [Bacteroidota bacterium]